MKDVTIDFKSRVFFVALVVAVTISLFITYYKHMVVENYVVWLDEDAELYLESLNNE